MFNSKETFDPKLPYPRNVSFPYNYSAHYIGQYPVAELQCWNKATRWHPHDFWACEPMPLEATADNVQMSSFAALALNSTTAVERHMPLLRNLTEYLVQNGLDPAMQLWSCDSCGPSAHNSNLAAKAIIAIGAFAKLCALVGGVYSAESGRYAKIAQAYAIEWRQRSKGGLFGGAKSHCES